MKTYLRLTPFIIIAAIAIYMLLNGGGITGLAVWNTTSEANFSEGNYNYTFYNTSTLAVELNISQGYATGNYTSTIFDSGTDTEWSNITIVREVCYQCEMQNESNQTFKYPVNLTDLLVYYRFNNDSTLTNGSNGSVIYDHSGNENNGTFFFAKGTSGWNESGKLKGGWMFDGDSDYIYSKLTFNQSMDFSVSAWVYTFGSTAAQGIFAKRDGAIGQIFGSINSNSSATLYVKDGFNLSEIVTTQIIENNSWNHLCFVLNTTNMSVYINGVLSLAGNLSSDNVSTHSPLEIGTGNAYVAGSVIKGINGTIDEFAIWNRSLNATEILNIYKRGALRLNLTYRACDDSECSGEEWVNLNNSAYN